MSPPFRLALLGLLGSVLLLAIGESFLIKAAVLLAFLVGGTMMLGGLAVGLLREAGRKAK